MVAAGRASVIEVGFDGEERQRAAIAALGLPTEAPAVDRVELLSHLRLDKKHDSRGLRMVVLEAVGRPMVRPVGSATVGAALAAVGISGGES
jgi:3-dehydroquinate synthetase